MSAESLEDLNTLTLIGMVEERGNAWHRRDDLQGAEDNHYLRHIPVSDVLRRLFNWEPVQAKVAYLVPADEPGAGTIFGADGRLYRVVETQAERVGILRNDTDYDLGVFKSGVEHPPYSITLVREAERLTGELLGISSAGLLAKGGRAWVEYSLPETLHDEKSGFGYRPNMVRADSMDGTLALTTALTINATVCDNTLSANLYEAGAEGRIYKRKHTSGIIGDLNNERQVLGILERVDEAFIKGLHALIERPVSPQQRIDIMDVIAPLPKDAQPGRALTLATNRRDQLQALDTDPMVAPWVGTAFGELQRYNTFDHWFAPVRGSGRAERNTWRALNGKRAEADTEVLAAINKVLV